MTRKRSFFLAVSILFVLLFAAVGANAAEEGGNAATERATEIFKWINFAILAGVIVWVFGKKLPSVETSKPGRGVMAAYLSPSGNQLVAVERPSFTGGEDLADQTVPLDSSATRPRYSLPVPLSVRRATTYAYSVPPGLAALLVSTRTLMSTSRADTSDK